MQKILFTELAAIRGLGINYGDVVAEGLGLHVEHFGSGNAAKHLELAQDGASELVDLSLHRALEQIHDIHDLHTIGSHSDGIDPHWDFHNFFNL